MLENFNWIKFDKNADRNSLPKERKLCLVCIGARETNGMGLPPGVAVGYLRFYSNNHTFWVLPGIEHEEVTHYCDCLPDDFGKTIPVWNWLN